MLGERASLTRPYPECEIVNLMPNSEESHAFRQLVFSALGAVEWRDDLPAETILRISSLLMQHPSVIWRGLKNIHSRLRQEDLGYNLVARFLNGNVRFLNIIRRNFLHAADVMVPRSEIVQKRVDACGFTGAVQCDGEWIAVPMCEVNTFRKELHSDKLKSTLSTWRPD